MQRIVDDAMMEEGTVDVFLEDGTEYKGCDFPGPLLFSENEQIVSFWVGDVLYNIPVRLVKLVLFHPPV